MEITDPISSLLRNKSHDLWTTSPGCSVLDAIQLMADKNVGALPVIEDGQLVGIITERDYTRKIVLKHKASKDTPVRSIMGTEPVTASPRDSVGKGMQAMTDKRVRHLPVLDDGKLVGIVSIGDLVKWTISAQGAMIQQLEGYIQGGYAGVD